MAVTTAPSVTVTPMPTLTDTAVPTVTIIPSATALPTATLTPLVPDVGRVTFSESFDDLSFPFDIWGPARIESGALVVEREANYQTPPGIWPFGGIYGKSPIPPGTTTVILFKAAGGAIFDIGYHAGSYDDETLRRFNFRGNEGRWDLYKGSANSFPIQTWNARHTHTNTWYYFSIKRSANGDMDAKLWQRDKPEDMLEFHGNLGSEWGTLPLTFFVDYRWGSFTLDEYQELQ